MSSDPEIQLVMNPVVKAFDSAIVAADLLRLQAKNSFHHYPVFKDSKLIGLCTKEDLNSAASDMTLEEICSKKVLSCAPEEKLCTVLDRLRESHCSAALIIDGDELLGIFTLSDVCQLFTDYLRFGIHPGENEYALP